MTEQEFLVNFRDILQCDDPIAAQTKLTELEEWDSLSIMALIAFFDYHFKQQINFEMIEPCIQVSDIIALAQGKITG